MENHHFFNKMVDVSRDRTCGKLKAVLLSPMIARESRIWLTYINTIIKNIQMLNYITQVLLINI